PRIRELVADPFAGLRWTSDRPWLVRASDPFQFLSHCKELVECNDNPAFITTLPLPFDASNSGAQHYAMLARDHTMARLTNLIDEGKPNDLYMTIADAVRNRLDTTVATGSEQEQRRAMWWRSRDINRKTIKPLVITFLYGAGSPGQQSDVFDILREDERETLFKELVPVDDEHGGWELKRRKPTRD